MARTLAQVSVDASRENSPSIDLLWTDSSGGTLIGTWSIEAGIAQGRGGSPYMPSADRPHWGVIADGKFRQLTTMGDLNVFGAIAW